MNDPEKILDEIYLPREPECGRWEPIETAPKDGTHVILYFAGWKPQIGSYCVSEYYRNGKLDHRTERWFGSWVSLAPISKDPEPTHWMPLPKAPVDDAE
jgi:hypothetical protein